MDYFSVSMKKKTEGAWKLSGFYFFPLRTLPVPSSKLVILALVFSFPCAWPASGLL